MRARDAPGRRAALSASAVAAADARDALLCPRAVSFSYAALKGADARRPSAFPAESPRRPYVEGAKAVTATTVLERLSSMRSNSAADLAADAPPLPAPRNEPPADDARDPRRRGAVHSGRPTRRPRSRAPRRPACGARACSARGDARGFHPAAPPAPWRETERAAPAATASTAASRRWTAASSPTERAVVPATSLNLPIGGLFTGVVLYLGDTFWLRVAAFDAEDASPATPTTPPPSATTVDSAFGEPEANPIATLVDATRLYSSWSMSSEAAARTSNSPALLRVAPSGVILVVAVGVPEGEDEVDKLVRQSGADEEERVDRVDRLAEKKIFLRVASRE